MICHVSGDSSLFSLMGFYYYYYYYYYFFMFLLWWLIILFGFVSTYVKTFFLFHRKTCPFLIWFMSLLW
ncbi:MAG: hypothetical protein N7Q72_05785, partial [Spiroplasma sp. Tabriz.8]|nr:hypothetical protein [Spiroplasma sp. Tabriz.8]